MTPFESATVTLKEYDKVSGYADEPLKKDAEELRRDTLRDDSKVLAQRDVPAIYRMLSKLEGSLSKVIIGLSALLDRIKDEVHLQKAELGRIELQKSVKSAAKTVFDRVTDGLGISPKVRSLSKAVEDSQAHMKDQAASYREALTAKDRMIADLGSEKGKMKSVACRPTESGLKGKTRISDPTMPPSVRPSATETSVFKRSCHSSSNTSSPNSWKSSLR